MSAFPQVLAVIALLHGSLAVDAQKILTDYDSLPLTKPKFTKPTYVFPSPGMGTATLVHNDPVSTELPLTKQQFEGLFTLVTGIGTGTSYSSSYLGAHQIHVTDPLKSWRVHLFCNGTTSVDRERVRDDDGSYSINRNETLTLDWFGGGQGFLMEQADTIGVFLVIIDPATDKQLAPWLTSLEQHYQIPALATGPGQYSFPQSKDYAVYGQLRDKFFYIVTAGRRWVSLIIIDDKPVGLFQSDFNHVVITSKRARLAPYVLVDKSLDEDDREDVMRLAMMAWLTTRSIGRTSY